jgi:hypothetical protein
VCHVRCRPVDGIRLRPQRLHVSGRKEARNAVAGAAKDDRVRPAVVPSRDGGEDGWAEGWIAEVEGEVVEALLW